MNTWSLNAVPIRLTDERWIHISEEHCELAGFRLDVLETISKPDILYAGNQGELLALKTMGINNDKWLVVVYREINPEDGFIITAFFTKRLQPFTKRRLLYERPTP